MVNMAEEKEISIAVGDYRYTLSRELSDLDHFVLKFAEKLNEKDIKYAIVSGYVAILFGRSRLSEDIDILIESLEFEEFYELWNFMIDDFWCIITSDPRDAYYRYLKENTAIRFALKDEVIPNVELKFPKTELEKWVLENTVPVKVGDKKINISNIEAQIAFKLYLGSEKDIEDAIHLYSFFSEGINKDLLNNFIKKLHIENSARRYLGWNSPR